MCKSISELRKSKKLSQGDAARILGLHQSAISHIETGRKRPSLEVALQMASLLGATVEDLFGDCRTPINVAAPENHCPTVTEAQLPA